MKSVKLIMYNNVNIMGFLPKLVVAMVENVLHDASHFCELSHPLLAAQHVQVRSAEDQIGSPMWSLSRMYLSSIHCVGSRSQLQYLEKKSIKKVSKST